MVELGDANLTGPSWASNPSQLHDDLKALKKVWSANSAALSVESAEFGALSRTCVFLKTLAQQVAGSLGPPGAFTHQTNCELNRESNQGAHIPGRLWFRVSATNDSRNLLAAPHMFLAISAQGCEFGFSAVAATNDPDTKALQRRIRKTAPDVFAILRRQRIAEATTDHEQGTNDWTFKRNDNPVLGNLRLKDVNQWLGFRKAVSEQRGRSIAIAKSLPLDAFDATRLSGEMSAAASLFQPLLPAGASELVAKRARSEIVPAEATGQSAPVGGPTDISAALSDFLTLLSRRWSKAFAIDEAFEFSINNLADRITGVAASEYGDAIRVVVDVGQGEWAPTPWIGLLDDQITESANQAVYAGLLLSEDLSHLSFMLYHGIRYSVPRYGGRASVAEMQRSFRLVREDLDPMSEHGFAVSRSRYLLTETEFEASFENATVACRTSPLAALDDEEWSKNLATLLKGYTRLSKRLIQPG